MEFIKKNLTTIIILVIILAVVCYFLCKKKDESGYAKKCPCPGVVISGKPGEVYYNTACCKRAVGLSGSASGTGVA